MNHKSFLIIDALSSETRFKILGTLLEAGPTAVENIAAALGMTHSAISHQLGFLQRAEILSCKKSGRHMIYQIAKTDAGKTARKLMRL